VLNVVENTAKRWPPNSALGPSGRLLPQMSDSLPDIESEHYFHTMNGDFFPCYTSVSHCETDILRLFKTLYDVPITISPNIFFGLNLQWANFDLQDNYHRYVISFHTEYIDHNWVIRQAQHVYPKTVVLISEFAIAPNPAWPDNIIFIQQRTLHKQLTISEKAHGVNRNITVPQYKFSSLSFRVSQYKIFITAFLLKHVPKDEMILTFHNQRLGPVASWPDNIHALQELTLDIPPTFINFDDQFNQSKNTPVANANWSCAPYQNALVNLTNESYHYSTSMIGNHTIVLPGPYFTEKTFKPLLAGRPFVFVNQFESIKELQTLGFDTNFGFSHDYDHDAGDFGRIARIFETVMQINNTPIKELFDSSIDAVTHNINHITSGNLSSACEELNRQQHSLLIAQCT